MTAGDRVVELSPAAEARVFVGAGRALETIAVPRVVLAPGDALMTVELATVCGSDVHTVSGHRSAPTPLVLGHEYVGRVLALGETGATDVEGRRLAPGDRVVWSILAACGRCDRCDRGLTQKCRGVRKYGHERLAPRGELTGGFATHTLVRAGTAIVRVDEQLPAETLAPLACGTATAWAALAAVEAVTPLEGATLLVFGAGLIGLTVAAIANDRGARVVAVDPDPRRRERALLFGASASIGPGDDPRQALDRGEITAVGPGDDPRRTLDRGDEITAVVEASGAAAAIDRAIAVAGVGAAIVLVGSVFPSPPVNVDAEHLVRTLLTLRGVHNYTADDLAGAAHWVQHRGRSYPFAELVGAIYPLDALDDALAVAATGTHVRVGVAPSAAIERPRHPAPAARERRAPDAHEASAAPR